MKIEFLVEDRSGGRLISEVMEKYRAEPGRNNVEYNVKPYKGMGGLKKGTDSANIKSEQLLSELPKRLRAIQMQSMYETNISVFVVLDNDRRDTNCFYIELKEVALNNSIVMDHVFCIAVEEMEAWLLGDFEALQKAYPKMKDRINSKYSAYQQDSICDTWETLADILTPDGLKGFRKKYRTVYEVGAKKYEWAEQIGSRMEIRKNRSPSFQRFLKELDMRSEVMVDR